MRKLTMRRRSYIWWNVAGIVVFIAGFLVGSINMAIHDGSMSGGAAITIAAILQIVGGVVAVVAFTLEMRRRFRVKRRERRLSTP